MGLKIVEDETVKQESLETKEPWGKKKKNNNKTAEAIINNKTVEQECGIQETVVGQRNCEAKDYRRQRNHGS